MLYGLSNEHVCIIRREALVEWRMKDVDYGKSERQELSTELMKFSSLREITNYWRPPYPYKNSTSTCTKITCDHMWFWNMFMWNFCKGRLATSRPRFVSPLFCNERRSRRKKRLERTLGKSNVHIVFLVKVILSSRIFYPQRKMMNGLKFKNKRNRNDNVAVLHTTSPRFQRSWDDVDYIYST